MDPDLQSGLTLPDFFTPSHAGIQPPHHHRMLLKNIRFPRRGNERVRRSAVYRPRLLRHISLTFADAPREFLTSSPAGIHFFNGIRLRGESWMPACRGNERVGRFAVYCVRLGAFTTAPQNPTRVERHRIGAGRSHHPSRRRGVPREPEPRVAFEPRDRGGERLDMRKIADRERRREPPVGDDDHPVGGLEDLEHLGAEHDHGVAVARRTRGAADRSRACSGCRRRGSAPRAASAAARAVSAWAIATFCWLPPESERMPWVERPRLDQEAAHRRPRRAPASASS